MSNGDKDYNDDVCRDYTRGVCNRGRSCKYKHPEELEGVESRSDHKYAFCHDYQNRECVRANCRFLHCSRAEEDYYKETGKLPPHLEEKVARGYGITGAESGGFDDVPICRDYQKGECNRGSKCKFRHMSRGDMEFEERRRMRSRYAPSTYGDREYDREYDRVRRRPPLEDRFGYLDFEAGRGSGDDFGARMAIRDRVRSSSRDTRDLEDENQILLRKVELMRKQISDLTAANEVLLEQNARLRASKSENNNALMQAETHLVRSTTGVPLLSQGSVAVIQKSAGTPGASGVTAINLIGQQEAGLGDRSQATLIASEMQTIPVSVSLQQEFQPVSLASVMTTQPAMPMQSVPTSILTYPIVSHNIHTAMGR
ncbi:zinc finger CCCH domain-containing protein 10-like isoform X1 [Patiria miniata]|uniref:C3H1-type domain-containing protein n=1 Tax=Patiria miniata TaxID=46514 RepID=A0A913Z1U5_PATMI|nr:zinc finger CCCH domain-containing protein 10-like isoform X1 [Patiria miniata]XP_038044976.1 zinc finger CCCH domain-containing protein 10-like isoform X1 [Patiria miniata]